jgi:hypothetical protein
MVIDSVNRICRLLKWAVLYKERTTGIRTGPHNTYPVKDEWSPYFLFFTYSVDLAPVMHILHRFELECPVVSHQLKASFRKCRFLLVLHPCCRCCKLKAELFARHILCIIRFPHRVHTRRCFVCPSILVSKLLYIFCRNLEMALHQKLSDKLNFGLWLYTVTRTLLENQKELLPVLWKAKILQKCT